MSYCSTRSSGDRCDVVVWKRCLLPKNATEGDSIRQEAPLYEILSATLSLVVIWRFSMSSAYPPYGDASTQPQPCQRCAMALPLNEVYCRNCGYYNAPAQGNNGAGSAQANVAWGATPPTSYGPQNQYAAGPQWGQPSPPAA